MSGPVRMCLGCGARLAKQELVRLVKAAGELMIDDAGGQPGRAVYCCRKTGCFQRLIKQRKKLAWALRGRDREKFSDLILQPGLEALFGSMPGIEG